MKYGIDEYGRYAEDESGTRFAVEFYPFWKRYPWRIRAIVGQAYDVFKWRIGMRFQ